MGNLPKFTERPGHDKNEPLTAAATPPEPFIADWLKGALEGMDRPRILDVGCGKGARVAWLCEQGLDAWGVEVTPRYVDAGRPYFDGRGLGEDRLRVVGEDGGYPFEPGSFDVILSDQVVEHVADVDQFAGEVARVGKTGSRGIHVFPARWRPVEVHMFTPFAHWLPKGAARRAAIRAALALGRGADYFDHLPARDRAEVFWTFSEQETFYRAPSELRRVFDASGLDGRFVEVEKLRQRGWSPVMQPLGAYVYRTLRAVYFETVKR